MVSKPFFGEARFSRVLGEFFLFFVGGSRCCFWFFVGCKVERCHRCQAQTGGNVSTLHDGQSFLIVLGQVCFGFSLYEHVQRFWSKTWSVRCQEYSSASASSAGGGKKEIVEHTNVSMRPQFLISCGFFHRQRFPGN